MTEVNSTQAARDALMNLLKSDDEGLVLQAAQSLLHHSGLFFAMDTTDDEEELVQFLHWLQGNKLIKLEVKSYMNLREVAVAYLDGEPDDGEGDSEDG